MHSLFIVTISLSLMYMLSNFCVARHIFDAKISKWLYISVLLAILFAGWIHISHFLTHQFQFAVVQQYSNATQSTIHNLIASYSGKSGSFLMWLTFVVILNAPLALSPKAGFERQKALSMLFPTILMMLLHFNNPFETTTNIHCLGLKPILQNNWSLLHPPTLFLGFSFFHLLSILAFDWKYFEKFLKKYLYLGIIFSGIGLVTGGLWSLNCFGRFWNWDIIEAAALVPFLLALALIFIPQELNRTRKIISASIFPMFILCSCLARSGLITKSYHQYADTSSLVWFLLLLSIITIFLIVIQKRKNKETKKSPSTIIQKNAYFYLSMTIIFLLLLSIFVIIVGICVSIMQHPLPPSYYNFYCVPLFSSILILTLIRAIIKIKRKK